MFAVLSGTHSIFERLQAPSRSRMINLVETAFQLVGVSRSGCSSRLSSPVCRLPSIRPGTWVFLLPGNGDVDKVTRYAKKLAVIILPDSLPEDNDIVLIPTRISHVTNFYIFVYLKN